MQKHNIVRLLRLAMLLDQKGHFELADTCDRIAADPRLRFRKGPKRIQDKKKHKQLQDHMREIDRSIADLIEQIFSRYDIMAQMKLFSYLLELKKEGRFDEAKEIIESRVIPEDVLRRSFEGTF